MGNGFHLRERQGADCGFHNRYLTTLFRTLFVHCPEHFQSHHGGPILAENNIVNVNALRKFESAGVIESRSSGMKGTYIKVLNDAVFDEIEELKRQNGRN